MTLEEKISFDSREDAALFQKFLRGKECGSRLVVEHTFSGELFFEGSIKGFMKLIFLLEKKDAEEGESDEELAFMKSDLENRKKLLDEFFTTHREGDDLENLMPIQMIAEIQSIGVESYEAFRKEVTEKFTSLLMILGTLDDNNLLKEAEDKNSYILTGTAQADDLRVMYPYIYFPKIPAEELEECGISTHIRILSSSKYNITVGTEIIFIDTNELADYLDNAYIDEEESARFINNVCFKQAFVGKIHELIEAGCSSEEKLTEALSEPVFPLEGTNDVISFDISREYLNGVLSDMKKLGLISGKDGKIKNI